MKEYFDQLHKHVEPFAFRSLAWEGQNAKAVNVCGSIGSQLVQAWQARVSGGAPNASKIAKFAKGGGGFASLTVFASSVPKVCLPLLWLDGPVTHSGTTINWRPLFADARRIRDLDMLRF
jgi:hypothetical protein